MFCTHILESWRHFLKGFLGLLARWHVHGDSDGNSTGLHTSRYNRNSGCNSTASCKYTRLRGRNGHLHCLGYGQIHPGRQPKMAYCIVVLPVLAPVPLYWAPPLAHWRYPAHSSHHHQQYWLWVVNSYVTGSPKYSTTTVSTSLPKPHCVRCHLQLAGCLSATTYFMSRIRSLVPSNTLHGSYLYCPAFSCFIPCLSLLNSVFSVRQ